MPSKKKKYNARFPAGRIKKIMQSDEEIGKVAQAVPVIISRTLELFVESLLTKTLKITNARNAKTLSTSHMKQCIMSEQRFDFLRELVKNIPDISVAEEEEEQYPAADTPYDLSMPSTSTRAQSQSQSQSQQRNTNALSTNGGNGGTAGTAASGDIVNYYKRLANNVNAAGNTSVIMHTTAVSNVNVYSDEKSLPPKLVRSESAPIQQLSGTPVSKPIWRPVETSPTTPRKRLKQQSHSMPQQQNNNSSSSSSSSSNNNNNNYDCSKPIKQEFDSPLFHPQPAIPPPIVNFDFCTKPVVKIDYSNLSLATATTTCTTTIATATAPLSAPVLGHHNNQHNYNNTKNTIAANAAFDFSTAAPIINIDLSNLITASTAATATATGTGTGTATVTTNDSSAQSPVINGPAVATISIGALPLTPASNNKPATTPNKIAAASKTNALFELDEDYDNI